MAGLETSVVPAGGPAGSGSKRTLTLKVAFGLGQVLDPPVPLLLELTELVSVASLTPSISLMRWSISATAVWLVAQPARVTLGRLPAGVAEVTDEVADLEVPDVELEPEELEELELLLELELDEELFLELLSLGWTTVPLSWESEICFGSTRPISCSVWAQSKRVSRAFQRPSCGPRSRRSSR